MFGLIDIQYVQITAQYSNAVLLAILPHISDFARKAELPLLSPITVAEVRAFGCDKHLGETGGAVALGNGYIFVFQHGHVRDFHTPQSYYHLNDFRQVPKFYGEYRMSADEAVLLCRRFMAKLGYTEEQLYADLEPEVKSAPATGTNTIPRFRVEWIDPRDGTPSCKFEVNAQDGRIESMWFLNHTLWREPPKIDVRPVPRRGGRFKSRVQPVNPEYAKALLSAVLPEVANYARQLALPVPVPLSTNQIASSVCRKFDGDVYLDLALTNGYRFFYSHGMVEDFDAPDCFFDLTLPGVKVSKFSGKWRTGQADAIELARGSLRALGYSLQELGADATPEVERPYKVLNVPRYLIKWHRGVDGRFLSNVTIEIDADHKAPKSVLIYSPALSKPIPDVGIAPETTEVWEQTPKP